MTATSRVGIVIWLIFIAISVYMTIQGLVSRALTATFTVMLAVLLALMCYEKNVAGIGLGIVRTDCAFRGRHGRNSVPQRTAAKEGFPPRAGRL